MIEKYLHALGHEEVKSIIEYVAEYPRTESIHYDNPLVVRHFDQTLTNIVFNQEEDRIFSPSTYKDVAYLLTVLETIKMDMLLLKADYICINKGAFLMLRLENDAKPMSGRSVRIELTHLASKLEVNSSLKRKQTIYTTASNVLITAFIAFGAYLVYQMNKI